MHLRQVFVSALRNIPRVNPVQRIPSTFIPPSYSFRTSRFISMDQTSASSAESTNPQSAAAAETDVEKQLKADLAKSIADIEAVKEKSKEFEDKYLRALAETENLRKRLTKQINEAKLFAIQGFCKDLTEISDVLQLAISSVPKDQFENKYLKDLYDGITMTEARLLQVYKKHGLIQINPIDCKFNPNEHEAVMQKDEPGKDSGVVIFVTKIGYKLNDRVIRPAVVGVAK